VILSSFTQYSIIPLFHYSNWGGAPKFYFNYLNEYLHSFQVISADIAVFSPAQDLDSAFPFWTQMNADYRDFKHKEQTIIKSFYRVYNKPGYGFLEKIYPVK